MSSWVDVANMTKQQMADVLFARTWQADRWGQGYGYKGKGKGKGGGKNGTQGKNGNKGNNGKQGNQGNGNQGNGTECTCCGKQGHNKAECRHVVKVCDNCG